MEYFEISARGEIIKIPVDTAKKIPIFCILLNGEWKDKNEPYYLNYSQDVVHKFIDYVCAGTINYICDIIDIIDETQYEQIILHDKTKMKLEFSSLLDTDYNVEYIKNIVPNIKFFDTNHSYSLICYREKICDNILVLSYITYLSYYKGYHLIDLCLESINKNNKCGKDECNLEIICKKTAICNNKLYSDKKTDKIKSLKDNKVAIKCFDKYLENSKFLHDDNKWYSYHYCDDEYNPAVKSKNMIIERENNRYIYCIKHTKKYISH